MSADGALPDLSAWRRELLDLYERLSRKIEQHKAIQLSAVELDLLVITGAYETLVMAMVAEQKRQAMERLGIAPVTPANESDAI